MYGKNDHVVKKNDLKTKQKIKKYAESLSSGIATGKAFNPTKSFDSAQHVTSNSFRTDTNIQIHSAGMQQYLCFLMPFSCGTDPLFF